MKTNNINTLLLATCYLLLATLFSGCGYTTGGAYIPDNVNTIYIPTFINMIDITLETSRNRVYQVYYPNLEIDITKSVINRFILDGNLRIAREETADWILRGKLKEFRRDPVRYADDEETVLEYRINIIVDLELVTEDDELLWEHNNFVGDTTYFTQGPTAKSESTAVDEAITDLSRRIVERVIENW